jgi:hypothetical protein
MKTWFTTLAFGFIILAGLYIFFKDADSAHCFATMAIFWLLASEFERS